MAQFLLITTLLSLAGLIATMIMGFLVAPGHVAQHIFAALATTILGLFSQSMTMFFFIGTGKEIKEKANNEANVVQRTKDFKNRAFPAAMWAIAALMVTFIMGGGVVSGKTPRWLHDASAFVTLVFLARAYIIELRAMIENASLMEKYLRD